MRHESRFSYVISVLAILICSVAVNATAEDQREEYSGFVINKSRSAINNSANG